jgi:hypothetical protein
MASYRFSSGATLPSKDDPGLNQARTRRDLSGNAFDHLVSEKSLGLGFVGEYRGIGGSLGRTLAVTFAYY